MYKVLICDDDEVFAELLQKKVKNCMEIRKKECDIELYSDGRELLEVLEERTPEIVFLDIDMPKISGMDMADHIFKRNIHTNVIFVTNRDDLVFQAIHYQPFRFIRKEKLNEELEEAVSCLLEKLDKDEKMMEVQTKEGTKRFPLKEVMYLESCKHYLTVCCCGGCYEVRGKISNFEKWMSEYDFVRIHRSYLVNLRFVKTIRATGVMLDNEELLPVSRDRLQEVKRQHMGFLRSCTYADC